MCDPFTPTETIAGKTFLDVAEAKWSLIYSVNYLYVTTESLSALFLADGTITAVLSHHFRY